MNNVLPARAGEFVRAHLGAKVSSETRTLVLATIASERLVDGLTLSIIFVIFSSGIGDQTVSRNLSYVAAAFGAVAVGVIVTLIFRAPIFALIEKVHLRFESKASHYTFNRLQLFVMQDEFSKKMFRVGAEGFVEELEHFEIPENSYVLFTQADD